MKFLTPPERGLWEGLQIHRKFDPADWKTELAKLDDDIRPYARDYLTGIWRRLEVKAAKKAELAERAKAEARRRQVYAR